MIHFVDGFKRFLRKAAFSYKSTFGAMTVQQYALVNIGAPLAQLICFTLAAHYAQPDYDITYWIIGNVLVLTYFNAIFGVGSQLSAEKSHRTLMLLVASPSDPMGILLPRAILNILDGLVAMGIGFGAGALLFGFRMPLDVLPSILLVLLIASFSAMAFGLIIACFGMITRDLNMLLNLASMILLGLTGANFPVSSLPTAFQWLSGCLPLTRSIELCRMLLKGEPLTAHWSLLLGEVGLGLVFMLIATLLFKVMERLARKDGVLEMF